jgi:hypothetical protein
MSGGTKWLDMRSMVAGVLMRVEGVESSDLKVELWLLGGSRRREGWNESIGMMLLIYPTGSYLHAGNAGIKLWC